MQDGNYRKIVVGDDFSNSIAYVVGVKYLKGGLQITDIIPSTSEEGCFDIYAKKYASAGSPFLWKRIPKRSIIDFEFDINFD